MPNLIKRLSNYNGSMEFIALSDEDIVDNYQHEFVVKYYKDYFENKNVLDAGCWTGPLEKTIVKNKIDTNLVGMDENKAALDVASRNFSEFKFIQCQLMESNDELIAEYKESFDTIIFLDVIEHLPKGKEAQVMKFFNKLLKPDGVLILSTMASHIFNFIDPAWFLGHRHYKEKKLEEIFNESNFKISENLKIGNLHWDLDLLYFYICKHIFNKKYQTSEKMRKKILAGLKGAKIPTRFYMKIKKNNI